MFILKGFSLCLVILELLSCYFCETLEFVCRPDVTGRTSAVFRARLQLVIPRLQPVKITENASRLEISTRQLEVVLSSHFLPHALFTN